MVVLGDFIHHSGSTSKWTWRCLGKGCSLSSSQSYTVLVRIQLHFFWPVSTCILWIKMLSDRKNLGLTLFVTCRRDFMIGKANGNHWNSPTLPIWKPKTMPRLWVYSWYSAPPVKPKRWSSNNCSHSPTIPHLCTQGRNLSDP